MDLLDFEAQGLYFDTKDAPEVEQMISTAAENYADGSAELPLLRAYFLAPTSLNVLVALNRFYYYQHRLEDAEVRRRVGAAAGAPLPAAVVRRQVAIDQHPHEVPFSPLP